MRTSWAGQALLGLGVTVGVVATAAWFIGYDPSTLPPAVLRLAAYKLTAIAAIGLMTAGAVVVRFARRSEPLSEPLSTQLDPAFLQAGDIEALHQHVSADKRSAPDAVAERRS